MVKSKKELLDEAVKETVSEITKVKLSVLECYDNLDAIRGVDDYVDSLLAIVAKYNEVPDNTDPAKAVKKPVTGITVSRLNRVFCDSNLLTSARQILVSRKLIVETKDGQTKRLNLLKQDGITESNQTAGS